MRFLPQKNFYFFVPEKKCHGSSTAFHGISQLFISVSDCFLFLYILRRVEIVFPVEDEKIKKELEHVLDLEFKDNVKAHILQPDGTYVKPDKRGKAQINSQMEFCIEATEKAALHKHEEKKSRVFIPAEPAEDIEE